MTRRLRALAALATLLGLAACGSSGAQTQVGRAQSAEAAREPCASRAGRFGVGRWPPACWRPYGRSSPFNTPIPLDAPVDPRSAATVASVTRAGPPHPLVAGYHGTREDWGRPTYYARRDDPVFRLVCVDFGGACPIRGKRIRIPDRARPARGGDAHLTVVDQATGWEYGLWRVVSKPRGGGVLRFGWGGRTRLHGDGLRSGATAAGFGTLAGLVRAPELAAGRIDHALFMVVPCTERNPRTGTGSYAFPASGPGAPCDDDQDAPPMGARFRLAMSEQEIAALPVPRWKKALFRAMSTYGMFVGDTGGGESWSLQVESDATYTSFGRRPRLARFARRAGWHASYDPAVGRRVYAGSFADDVDWASRLRVVHPCVTRGSC
jgi:hypothetical protein